MSAGKSAPLLMALAIVLSTASALAADQTIHRKALHASRAAEQDCECCRCWQPEYVRHPEIVYAYPQDPRYTLTVEPHYLFGRTYTFVHNW
jgi:hypothetical protein